MEMGVPEWYFEFFRFLTKNQNNLFYSAQFSIDLKKSFIYVPKYSQRWSLFFSFQAVTHEKE